jgi:hypothetical protein
MTQQEYPNDYLLHFTPDDLAIGTQHTPWLHKSRAKGFCTAMTPTIYGSSVWELPHVTPLAPRILRWLPEFRKIHAPLTYPKSFPVSLDCNNLHNCVPFFVTYITTLIGILHDVSVRQDFDSYKIVMSLPAFFHYIRRLYGTK